MPRTRLLLAACLVVAVAVGCKKDKKDAAPVDVPAVGSGSGTAAGTAAVAATGSGSAGSAGSGSASMTGSDAGSATASLVISQQGVGPIQDLEQTTVDADEQQKRLEGLLAPLGLTISMEVMDMPGEIEREEGYFSAKKGDKEILQIFDAAVEVNPNITIHVVDPMFATTDGIKVGDKLSVLADKRKDLACTADSDAELGFLTCKSAAEPDIVFVLDATDYKGKSGKPIDLAKNADRALLEIVR
jgi:hypothetical protein